MSLNLLKYSLVRGMGHLCACTRLHNVLKTDGRDLLPQALIFFRTSIGGAEGTTQNTQVNVHKSLFAFFGVSRKGLHL